MSIVSIINWLVEFNNILQILVIQFVPLESLKLSIKIFSLISWQQVDKNDRVQFIEIVRFLKFREVLIKEMQSLDCSLEFIILIASKTIEYIIFSEVASFDNKLRTLPSKIRVGINDKLNEGNTTFNFFVI